MPKEVICLPGNHSVRRGALGLGGYQEQVQGARKMIKWKGIVNDDLISFIAYLVR